MFPDAEGDACHRQGIWSFCICRNDHKMALIEMGSVEEAVGALVVSETASLTVLSWIQF